MYTNDIVTYEGDEPYVFISYAHLDSEKVLPIIAGLQQRGFRIWFDEGIEAGSEWPEYVAEHLLGSACVAAFITPNAVASVNCRQEINFAIDEGKPLLIIYLEKTELTAGMKMRLNSNQQIFYDRHADEESFLNALSEAEILKPCRDGEQENVERRIVKTIRTASAGVKRTFELTIFSPINVDVYLDNESNQIMKIDKYSGFDYKFNNITTGEEFTLIFKSNRLEKRITLKAPDAGERFEYRLDAVLSDLEILSTYDREEALQILSLKPSGYAFEQLEAVGKAEDIDVLLALLNELEDAYLVASCMRTLGALAKKYKKDVTAEMVAVYIPYDRKSSYAWMFEKYLPNEIVEKFKEKK